MRCPSLSELPPPPDGLDGWPWTVESPRLPDLLPDGTAWPRISVVVATLNQRDYIEKMIRSLLLQGYPDVEFILCDGGSTDGTIELVERYRPWIEYWKSEPDRGQADAWNKGLTQATGSLFNLFNTDDLFTAGALGVVGMAHAATPGHVIAGDVLRTWEGEDRTEIHRPEVSTAREYAQWWQTNHHGQPGIYFPRARLAEVGPLDESLHYHLDYQFTTRFLDVAPMRVLRSPVAIIVHNDACKSSSQGHFFDWELARVSEASYARYPEFRKKGAEELAGVLFGIGLKRLLTRQGQWRQFMAKGLSLDPVRAVWWVFPGWLLRKVRRRKAP